MLVAKLTFTTKFELLLLCFVIMLAFSSKMTILLVLFNFVPRLIIEQNYLLCWYFVLTSASGFEMSNHPIDFKQFKLELITVLIDCQHLIPSFRLAFSSDSTVPISHFAARPTSGSI